MSVPSPTLDQSATTCPECGGTNLWVIIKWNGPKKYCLDCNFQCECGQKYRRASKGICPACSEPQSDKSDADRVAGWMALIRQGSVSAQRISNLGQIGPTGRAAHSLLTEILEKRGSEVLAAAAKDALREHALNASSLNQAVACSKPLPPVKNEPVADKIHFQCPKCSKSVSVRKEYAGKRARCPGCGTVVSIPSSDPGLKPQVLTIATCPKCGQTLAEGAPRCSATGCDYVLSAGVKAGSASDPMSQMLGNMLGAISAAQAAPASNPLPVSGVCDRCNGCISKGEGYSFFSSASINGQLTGNMLLCEDCTAKIMTPEHWQKEIPKQRELSGADILANPNALLDMMHTVNADSIVQNCKERGFTPEQAKEKARDFAKRWWNAPEATQRESAKFWTLGLTKPATQGRDNKAARPRTPEEKFKSVVNCLKFIGWFNVVATGLSFAVYAAMVLAGVQKDDPHAPHPAIIFIAQIIGMLVAVAVIRGAIQIQQREKHSSALITAALASIPIGACCLVTFPIGLYCLVTLYDKDVKSLFT